MAIRRCVMFPWDGTAGDGIKTGVLPETGFTSGTRFRLGKRSCEGMYARAKGWQLSIGLTVTPVGGGDSFTGNINLVAVAVSHATDGNVPLGDESEVSKHGGYYKEDLTPSLWTAHTSGGDFTYDPGRIALRFADVTGVVDSGVTLGPILEFEPVTGCSLVFGENGSNVAAHVDGGLPVTQDGTFDGYDEGPQTFTLKIGAAAGITSGFDVVGVGGTFHPVTWWPYDPGDGGGPVYKAAGPEGEWLRDARAFK